MDEEQEAEEEAPVAKGRDRRSAKKSASKKKSTSKRSKGGKKSRSKRATSPKKPAFFQEEEPEFDEPEDI